jgi:hypothetical protein
MTDPHEIVDDIRAVLASVDQTRSDRLAELARAYAAACKECNDRLRRCGDYLRRGMRSEAIHLADVQPTLLDVVATLYFQELPEWGELCLAYEMTAPPKLLMEVAQEVNESYAAEQPIQSLLARHRLLALVQAPLAERIDVMRELAGQDAQNPWWEEDLRVFETARLGQLRGEAATAVRERDGGRVGRLLVELEAPGWRAPVPADLTRALQQSAHEIRRDEVLRELRATLPELEAAYNAMDFAEADRLLSAWDARAADANPLPDDVRERVAPVRDWTTGERRRHATEQRFRADCVRLKHAAETQAPTPELLELRSAAEAHGLPLPAELVALAYGLLEQRERARRRRVRRNVALASVAVLLCMAGVGWVIRDQMLARQARQWARQVTQHVESDRLADAAGTWEGMLAQAPQTERRPELVRAKQLLDAAIAAEDERRETFRQQMDRAAAAGTRKPDLGALQAARAAAKTPADKLEVLNLEAEIAAHATAKQRERDDAFQKDVGLLAADVRRLERDVAAEATLDTVGASLTAAEGAAATLAARPGIGTAARASLEPVAARLRAVRERFQEVAGQSDELAKVTSAPPGQLAPALRAFAARFPDSPRAAAFLRAAEEESAWSAVLDWSAIASGWGYRFVPSSAADIGKRLAQIEAFLKVHANSPLAGAVDAYRAYLKQAEVAASPEGPWKTGLVATMNSPLVSRLNRLRTTDGRSFYVVGDGGLSLTKIGNRVAGYRFEAILTNDIEKPAPQIEKGELQSPAALSPQAKLSADVLRMTSAFDYDEWEYFGPAVLDRIRTDAELDPILGVILSTRVLRFIDAGGWGLGEHMRAASEALESLNADDLSWMNPGDESANQARPRAREVLSAIPAMAKVRPTVLASRQGVFRPLSFRIRATALILLESAKPVVRAGAKPTDGHHVLAVVTADGAGGKTLRKIGAVRGGAFELEPAAARLPEGSLVFLCETTDGVRAAPAKSRSGGS